MTDDGYTLAECLVALFVIGLSIAGLSAGMMSISRLQASAGRIANGDRTVRLVHESLGRLLDGQGPFASSQSDQFLGSATEFEFNCNSPTTCGARLAAASGGTDLIVAEPGRPVRSFLLPGVTSAQFSYAGTRTIGPSWPPQTQDSQSLSSVGLVAATAAGTFPVTSVRVWIEQSASCQFDAITQSCRGQSQ